MSTVESTTSLILKEGVSGLPPNLLLGLGEVLEHCGEEEVRHVEFVLKNFVSYESWVREVVNGQGELEPLKVDLHFYPRMLSCSGEKVDFIPPLLFIEGVFDTTQKAFNIYLAERMQKGGRQKAFWALQVAYGLSNVMDLIKKMGEDKVVWKDTSWSVVDKRFHVHRSSTFGRSFQQSTYFLFYPETLYAGNNS